jgi:hypothetical protein
VYWDLAEAVRASGGSLENTNTLEFSFDFLIERGRHFGGTDNGGFMANDNTFFDLTTALGSGAANANPGRFARWGLMYSWNQFNMFGATADRINGDRTHLNTNNQMENKWYRITVNVDLSEMTITTSLHERDNNMAVLNGRPFTISTGAGDTRYPSAADLSRLFFAIYPDQTGSTDRKIEFYIDNLVLRYFDFA